MSWDCASLGPEHQPPLRAPQTQNRLTPDSSSLPPTHPISHCWPVPWQHLPAPWACHPEAACPPSFTLTFPHRDTCANHVLPSHRARMGQSLPIIGDTWAEPLSWSERRFQSQGYASALRLFCLRALLRYNSPISNKQFTVFLSIFQMLHHLRLCLVPEHFRHPKGNPISNHSPFPLLQPLATTDLLSGSVSWPVLDVSWCHTSCDLCV